MHTGAAVIVGDHTQGLGIARSAAMAGAAVWIVNDKCVSLARFSRYITGYKRLRRGALSRLARTDCATHLREALLDIPFYGPAVLFGVNEDITWFIHRNRAALRAKYWIPEVRFESIYDKFAFNTLLPEAVRLETRLCCETDLGAVDRPHRFILKGRLANAFRQITGQKAIRLSQIATHERQDLFAKLAPDQVLLQRIVETSRPVVSVCSFAVSGQIAACFGYEKLRQHPNRFGTGTYLRSTSVGHFAPVAECILERLDFTGISEIEFIHDPDSDTYRVIEMNPRTWKSIHFATQCGQNLVARYLSHVANAPTESRNGYARDRYWADLATDIPQMLRERKLWRYHRGFFECTWDRSDPLPALALWTLFPVIALETLYPCSPRAATPTCKCNAPSASVRAFRRTISRNGELCLRKSKLVSGNSRKSLAAMLSTRLYYQCKRFIPKRLRLTLRRIHASRILKRCGGIWPIKQSAGRKPANWPGWPDGKGFAFVLTHDVEAPRGLDRVKALGELEMELGFRSSFNFVPEGAYVVPAHLRTWLDNRGFEVGVHDLHHDGSLFRSHTDFHQQAPRINHHLKEWGAVGFRAGFMFHELDWIRNLDIEYDASTFDIDPFEPQPDGANTIFPFHVPPKDGRSGYVELPYTLAQDSTLFLFLQQSTANIWKQKLDWVAQQEGMALVNVHPDYIAFDGSPSSFEFSVARYRDLLLAQGTATPKRFGTSFLATLLAGTDHTSISRFRPSRRSITPALA